MTRVIKKLIVPVAFIFIALLIFSGCSKKIEIDTSGMYLVIYDGNGGYLGNKTAMTRKLFCYPGSKIPDYPVDYTTNQYTVSSLGLAMRNGYQLLGWYSNADYSENPNGDYIYLPTDEGCGVYESDLNGTFVHKYIPAEDGKFVFVYVEEPDKPEEGEEASPVTYIFIDAKEGVDGKPLSVETGFYICGGEDDINNIENEDLREAYRASFEKKTYSASSLSAVSGWQVFEDLSDEYKELFKNLDRNSYSFGKAESADKDLDHYSLVSDYASVFNIFVENPNGLYVQTGNDFVKYDEKNPDHQKLKRFSVNENYVFNKNDTSSLKKFDAAMKYWDFANDKVTEDVCTWDGEKFVLTLYAHWEKKNTVYYHYNNGTGQVDESTKKLLDDNITYENIEPGKTIGRKEIVPGFAEHTFLGWSVSESEYKPWDFANDVFPENSSEFHLYAYFIDGVYKRIDSPSGLKTIGEDPDGKYLLVSDIDFKDAVVNDPFGLYEAGKPFTGELISTGYKIKNFKMELVGKKTQTPTDIVGVAPIYMVDGAKIENIGIEYTVVASAVDRKVKLPMNFFCSGLIGTAGSTKKTEVKDCSVSLTVVSKTDTTFDNPVVIYSFTLTDFCAVDADNVTLSGCTSAFDYEGLKGAVEVIESKLVK